MSDALERAVDELYGVPLDEFIRRRDALARELRAAGEREAADGVKRLVKPSGPAWVVNRLARERADDVRRLLDAGDELRQVQEWLLRREADPADLRAAVEAERSAVAKLVHAGADLLIGAGRAARGDVLERIGETLHAAAADPEVRADLERGRVVHDRAAVGLGAVTRGAAPTGTAREAAREALRAAEAEARAADRMRVAAERTVDTATRALDAAEANWERARAELGSARDELAASEKAAAAAREAAEAAAAEAEARRRQIDDAAGD